jgi:hypothetical protein
MVTSNYQNTILLVAAIDLCKQCEAVLNGYLEEESETTKVATKTWLPVGIFSYQNSQFGSIFECQEVINLQPFGIFDGQQVYFVVISYMYYPRFGISHLEISGNPDLCLK